MAATVKVIGLDKVLVNLNKEIAKIEGDVQKGLTLGMQIIKRDSMDQTPVDTGNLRSSHYVVVAKGAQDTRSGSFKTVDDSGKRVASEHPKHIAESIANAKAKRGPFAEVGCTAFYAEKVHEDLQASHVKELYTGGKKKGKKFVGPMQPVPMGPVGKAKFLEDSIRKNADKVLALIKLYAKR